MKRNARQLKEKMMFSLSASSLVLVVGFLGLIIAFLVARGAEVISWEFLTEMPRQAMSEGGIYPAIIGTLLLALGAIIFAVPLGILAAIYLSEYAREGRLKRWIRIGINALSGVPSVVFGLFGLAIFVIFFDFGASLLSGSLTLGLLILPLIIRSTEEALKTVPNSFREASLGLGATKWQTTLRVVLPTAFPNILTGVILAVGRAAGETAPILFTATVFFMKRMPEGIMSKVMALPYHIYALMSEGIYPEKHTAIAYGTALVLLGLVFLVNLTAIILRARARKRKKW